MRLYEIHGLRLKCLRAKLIEFGMVRKYVHNKVPRFHCLLSHYSKIPVKEHDGQGYLHCLEKDDSLLLNTNMRKSIMSPDDPPEMKHNPSTQQ